MANPNTTLPLTGLHPTIRDNDISTFIPDPAVGLAMRELQSLPCTIDSIAVMTTAGTVDVEVRINGALVTFAAGTAVPAGTTPATSVAVGNNIVGLHSRVDATLINDAASVGLAITIHRTRTP